VDWSDFPPYIVVTGTVRVQGGETRKMSSSRNGDHEIVARLHKIVTDAKRRGDVVAARYMRRVKELRVVKTPFGSLVHTDQLGDIKQMISEANREIEAFNATEEGTALRNCIVWEPLRGNRLQAVKLWCADHPDDAARIKAA